MKIWPTPTNVTEVWSFLGFTGYYMWFIPKFAQMAWPLHELTSGKNVGKKKAAIVWDDRCQQSFDDLKCLCTTVPILTYADSTRPFKLHIDTCRSGLGAVLYQTHDDGMDAIITYASRSLTKAKSHYPAHKLEFLTPKWAVVEIFHEHLYRSTFDVYTDNNSLTYVLTTAKLNVQVTAGWPAWPITTFSCIIGWGKTNINVGALSRLSWLGCMPDTVDTHVQVTVETVIQDAALKGSVTPDQSL